MALGRPKVALILTDDERMRLDSLAHRSRTAPDLARPACGSPSRRAKICPTRNATHENTKTRKGE